MVAALAAAVLPGLDAAVHEEVRALWVVRTSLVSRRAVADMVDAASTAGFNTLIVQVRGRGDAYFAGGAEPRPPALAAQPDFDPLAETLARAHAAGLRVHAWVNVNLVSSAVELPESREHLVYRHPEWLMVPRALAPALAELEPSSPEYLDRLARYVRDQPNTLEGLYASPIDPAAAEYAAGIVADLVRRYAVDGVHLDYVRYPNEDFDYSRGALERFRQEMAEGLTPAQRAQYDGRLAAEPFVYPDSFPDRWHDYRSRRLTHLVTRVRDTVKSIRSSALVSAAVFPDPADAFDRRMQNWPGWLADGLLDVVCPMAYAIDPAVFADQIAAAGQAAEANRLWAGIGAFRLSADHIATNVRAARRLGAGGIVLFSYDSLTASDRSPGYLSDVARAAFGQAVR
jgi:uncharacterized lipoprotein YddW (UPF0748 family)